MPHELRNYVLKYHEEPVGSSSLVAVPLSLRAQTARTEVDVLWLWERLAGLNLLFRCLEPPSKPLSSWTEDAEWRPANTVEGYYQIHLQTLMDAWQRHGTYQKRIGALARFGVDEGISLNEDSESDFWTFERAAGFTRPAGFALMDSGNLRAVWKGDNEDHLGIHFLGDHTANYVIFKKRAGTRQTSRVAGNDTLEGVRKQIRAFDLASLVNR